MLLTVSVFALAVAILLRGALYRSGCDTTIDYSHQTIINNEKEDDNNTNIKSSNETCSALIPKS